MHSPVIDIGQRSHRYLLCTSAKRGYGGDVQGQPIHRVKRDYSRGRDEDVTIVVRSDKNGQDQE